MKLESEGLRFRGRLFQAQFLPFDDVVRSEGQTLSLASGAWVRVPREVATAVREVVAGPRAAQGLLHAAQSFLAYVTGPLWAPERAARALLDVAGQLEATDVHLEAEADQIGIRLRLAGEVVPFTALPLAIGTRLVAALKRLAGCLPYRRDVVQEGRIPRAGVASDVRASFVPTSLGERVALRLFGKLLRLEQLRSDRRSVQGSVP